MKLYMFQEHLLQFALSRKKAALFWATGMGKSVLCVNYATTLADQGMRVLVVAPLCMSETYRNQLPSTVTVTNYEQLSRMDATAFAAFVIDESSILKHNGKWAQTLREVTRNATYILSLSATPAPNNYHEILRQAELLQLDTYDNLLATYFSRYPSIRLKPAASGPFASWVCTWSRWGDTPSHLGAQFTREDAKFRLPAHHVHYRECTAAETSGTTPNSNQNRLVVRRTGISTRVRECARLLTGSCGDGVGPWVVWCTLSQEAHDLCRQPCGELRMACIDGTTRTQDRRRILMDFERGDIDVLVTKPSISGFGLNWQHCCRQIFLSVTDSYEMFHQASRRLWRFGQTKDVHTYVLYTPEEQAVIDNIQAKSRSSNTLLALMTATQASGTATSTHEHCTSATVPRVAAGYMYTVTTDCCLAAMQDMGPECVDYSLFSPPFLGMYKYSADPRDISNVALQTYTETMQSVAAHLLRITRPGRLCTFHCMNVPAHSAGIGVGTGNHGRASGLFDLRGLLTSAFAAAGWLLHSETTVYRCPSEALIKTKAQGLFHKTYVKDAAMCRQSLPDYLVTFRKPGSNHTPISHSPDMELWKSLASCVWHVTHTRVLRPSTKHHPTPLQIDIAERCIGLWSNVGETVFCPFMGIGTVGVAALRAGRRFSGIELNAAFSAQAVEFLNKVDALPGSASHLCHQSA